MIKRLFKPSSLKLSLFIALITVVLMIFNEFSAERDAWAFKFLTDVEYKALDNMFVIRGRRPIGDKIAIAAVDERSLDALGRWPWPRSIIGKLVDKLSELGVKVIAFDAIFDYPDKNNTLSLLNSIEDKLREKNLTDESFNKLTKNLDLAQNKLTGNMSDLKEQLKKPLLAKSFKLDLSPLSENLNSSKELAQKMQVNLRDMQAYLGKEKVYANQDLAFSEALKRSKERGTKVIMGYFYYATPEEVAELDKDVLEKGAKLNEPYAISILKLGPQINTNLFRHIFGFRTNLEMFNLASFSGGYFNQIPDGDGVLRRTPLFAYYKRTENYFPALSLSALSAYLNKPIKLEIGTPNLAQEQTEQVCLMLGDQTIPVDDRGQFVINYYGDKLTFPHYSVIDIIEGKVTKELLQNRIVLFGATAVGIYDLRNTPMDEVFPGVEIHANLMNNVLTEDYLTRPNLVRGLEMIIILVIGLLLGAILSHIRLQYGAMLTTLLAGLYLFSAYYFFFLNGLWLKVMMPTIEMFAILLTVGIFRYMTEEREKAKIRQAFHYYLTPTVVEQVTADPSRLKLGGDKRNMSVLFSDIRGFTTISEKLSPEALTHLLNEYLTPMTDIVFETQGTIDKYIGDALMAFWGAPLDQPNHATKACFSALEMIKKLKELRVGWEQKGYPFIDIGVGINSGNMVVGNMGSNFRFNYTVMGDNVNLASRLEGINKTYKTNIVISEYTFEQVKEYIIARELDFVRVKGKYEPIRIYELVAKAGEIDEKTRSKLEFFQLGLSAYREMKWDDAEQAFTSTLSIDPNDGPSHIFLERVKTLRSVPPPADWGGVWVMTTK